MDMASDLVKDAVIVRKSLLGYMGDRHMSFRETLAQNVLLVGLDKPKIRNEVYLQVGFAGSAASFSYCTMIMIPAVVDTWRCLCCYPAFGRLYCKSILVRTQNNIQRMRAC